MKIPEQKYIKTQLEDLRKIIDTFEDMNVKYLSYNDLISLKNKGEKIIQLSNFMKNKKENIEIFNLNQK